MVIEKIIEKMSLEDKFRFLIGKDSWRTVDFKELGINEVSVSDGPHGLRKEYVDEEGKMKAVEAVVFPTASAVAATWNLEKTFEIGRALAGECIRHNIDILLGPAVNMKRTPLCGRNFEYYSEDPLLSGKLASEYIKGVQSVGIGTSLKHFAANNQEYDRFYGSSEIDERTLREIYLKVFEIAVKEGKPWTVMCAYNRLNGVHCSQNKKLLDDILRKEWGFEGIVISDWTAVHDRAAALRASLELEMPYSEASFPNLISAYENGEITDEQINRAVENLLRFVFKVDSEKEKRKAISRTLEEQLSIARDVAKEAITLLKNEEKILPITQQKVKKISIVGDLAKYPVIQGGGSSGVTPIIVEKPYEEILKIAGKDYEVKFSSAYKCTSWHTYNEIMNVGEAMEVAYESDLVLLFVGESDKIAAEAYDRLAMKLTPDMENVILDVAKMNPNIVVIVQAGTAIDMSNWIDKVKGVVFQWYTGSCGGSALAEILFGKTNPSGKLSETFPLTIEGTLVHNNKKNEGMVSWYQEGLLVGYRYYDTKNKEVLFPFGHGLSYTTFEYSNLKLSEDKLCKDKKLLVSFKVKNTGDVEGKEIVQLYIRDVVATVIRPYKELKAFSKIKLLPGEEKELEMELNFKDFAFYSTVYDDWNVEKGAFEILIGASSKDIRLMGKISYN